MRRATRGSSFLVSVFKRFEVDNKVEEEGGRCGFGIKGGECKVYRGTSLIRNCFLLGPYCRLMPRALWWSYWG